MKVKLAEPSELQKPIKTDLARKTISLFLHVVVIYLLIAPIAVAQVNPLVQVLKDYSNNHNFEAKYNHLIWNIVRDALSGTSIQGKVTINSSDPKSDAINFFVIARDPDQYFQQIACNCAYIRELRAIVCDHTLLDYFTGLLHWNAPGSKYVDPLTSEFLLRWIIAHEIGHVVKDLVTPTDLTSNPTAKITHGEEVAADEFAAGSIQSPPQQQMAWLTIGDVIETLYMDGLIKQAKPPGPPAPDPTELNQLIFDSAVHLVLPDTGDPHPPWLIRALNFESTLRSKYPETVFDTTGFYPKMISSISVTAQQIQPRPLCDAHLDVLHDKALIQLNRAPLSDYNFHAFRAMNLFRIAAYQSVIPEATAWIGTLHGSNNLKPDEVARPYLIRAEALSALGKYSAAVSDYQKALVYTPNDVELHDNLAFGYFELREIPKAITEWLNAIKLKPDLADALAGLATAYYSTGQKDNGLARLKQALNLDPLYASEDYLRYEAFWSEGQIGTEQSMVRLLSHKN
jgi:tetratricopeptide (TPR) repeat protein